MIYLITEINQSIIKIGYTSNIAVRMNTYYTYNPNAYLIDVEEGSEKDEKNWHLVLEYLGFERIVKNENVLEWFKIPKEIAKNEIKKYGFDYLRVMCINKNNKENAWKSIFLIPEFGHKCPKNFTTSAPKKSRVFCDFF